MRNYMWAKRQRLKGTDEVSRNQVSSFSLLAEMRNISSIRGSKGRPPIGEDSAMKHAQTLGRRRFGWAWFRFWVGGLRFPHERTQDGAEFF